MLLSYNEIRDLIDADVIEYADHELVNSASLDIRLGSTILIERPALERGKSYEGMPLKELVLRERTKMNMIEHNLKTDGPYAIYPGEFILAHSIEVFNLPMDISAEYKLKSTMARMGLEHLNAGWCDAGWNGSTLTMELFNVSRCHQIVLQYMDKIGQMVFFRHRPVPQDKSYAARGAYNNDLSVSMAKPEITVPPNVLLIDGE